MEHLDKCDLGDLGTGYVNETLRTGGWVSRLLFDLNGPVNNAFTTMPKNVQPSSARCLQSGGVTSFKSTIAWFVCDTQAAGIRRNASFLVEDSFMKPEDSRAEEDVHRFLRHAPSLYYGASGEDMSELAVHNALRCVKIFDFIGFVADVPIPNTDHLSALDQTAAINAFVRHIRLIVASAFDREGLVISRTQPK